MKVYQCRMHQECDVISKNYIITAWIEEKGAGVGKIVELKGEPGLWTVDFVGVSLEESELKSKQLKDRRNLVSITA